MHPYLTERMLHQSAALAPLGAIAVQHRERLDGSGYPRGLAGGAISRPARVLGAADAYQAMREPRPYRAAPSADEAAARAARRGPRGAARRRRRGGRARRRRPPRPAPPRGTGRTDAARDRRPSPGRARLSNKQIAQRLVISPKTAGNHVEHIYTKIGASSRAVAGLFAMQHGLLPEDEVNAP